MPRDLSENQKYITMSKQNFIQEIATGYTFEGHSIDLGAAMYDKETQTGSLVKLT